MASFHTVRLALFDGRSTAFKKFNANTGYKAQGTRPNKVSMPSLSFFGIFPPLLLFLLRAFLTTFFLFENCKNHDRAKDFWMKELDTTFNYYKQETLDHFRGVLGVSEDFYICSSLINCSYDYHKNCVLSLVKHRLEI